jgi:hypothetical protein
MISSLSSATDMAWPRPPPAPALECRRMRVKPLTAVEAKQRKTRFDISIARQYSLAM